MSRKNDNHIPAYSQDLIEQKLPLLAPVKSAKDLMSLPDRELGFYFGQQALVEKLNQLLEADRQEK